MNKYTFMVYHKEYEDFLICLRDLGMLHVVAKPFDAEDTNEEIQSRVSEQKNQAEIIRYLEKINEGAKVSPDETIEQAYLDEPDKIVDIVTTLRSKVEKLEQNRIAVAKEREDMLPWGDFSFETIAKLTDAGFVIGFYTCPVSKFDKQWEEQYNAQIIASEQNVTHFITITKADDAIEMDAEKAKLSTRNLSAIEADFLSIENGIRTTREELKQLAKAKLQTIKAIQTKSIQEFTFSKIVFGTERLASSKLMLLEGWAPADREAEIKTFLESQAVYYEVRQPLPEDDVPILLKNNAFSRLFEPICKLYMLPKYSEIDLTPFFAPFFMIFFGLCLGDSGYGLFMVLACIIYRMTAKAMSDTVKSVITLVTILGTSTMFCGLLTGTFFGANIYEWGIPALDSLKDAVYLDNNEMFNLSLVMGVIQIIFGMILKTANRVIQFGWLHGVSTLGWILVLVSSLFAAMMPDVLPVMGTVHNAILGVAALGIFLLNSPGKNPFMNIGIGMWDTYNMATGLLGDILSYVRLFALGLSGGILASVFNSLAVGLSPDNVIAGPIVMGLIFLIGHSINMFMNILGAMVHPMRLTFVEFFKNAEYAGGGREYSPFKN